MQRGCCSPSTTPQLRPNRRASSRAPVHLLPVMTSDTLGARRLPEARRSLVVPDPIHRNAVPDSIHRNEDVEYHAPVHDLRPETFVYDRTRNLQIMRIQGVVPLPIGAQIELVAPNVHATVVGVRLLEGVYEVPCLANRRSMVVP